MQSYASQRALPWKEGPFSLRWRWLLADLLAGSPTLSAAFRLIWLVCPSEKPQVLLDKKNPVQVG